MFQSIKKLHPAAVAAIVVTAIALVITSFILSFGSGFGKVVYHEKPPYAAEMQKDGKGAAAQAYGAGYSQAPNVKGGPPGMTSGGYCGSSGPSYGGQSGSGQ